MTPIILDVEQRTDAWHLARVGRLCGSRAKDMLATIKSGGEAAGRRNLRAQLLLERITGKPQEKGFVSAAMQDGIAREMDACGLYEALTGELLTPVGFVQHPELMAGCSPDGCIFDGDRIVGIIEAKSPIPATHLDYLTTGKVPGDYYKQCLHNLWITDAEWCDWFSYQPDFPDPIRVKLVRIVRNQTEMDAYELNARAFLREVDAEVEKVRKLLAEQAAA